MDPYLGLKDLRFVAAGEEAMPLCLSPVNTREKGG